jgi:hypothetical protein
METTRAKITGTVGELRENVNRAVDWREQVKTHPGAALGAAATGGILLGHWLGAKMAPGRLAPEHRQERMPTSASSGRDALERLVDSSRVPSFGPRESRH